MPADHPPDHPLRGEVVEAPRLAVALAGCVDEGQTPRRAGLLEAPLKGDGELFRKPDPDETAGRHGVAVHDHARGVLDGDYLVALHAYSSSGRPKLLNLPPFPATRNRANAIRFGRRWLRRSGSVLGEVVLVAVLRGLAGLPADLAAYYLVHITVKTRPTKITPSARSPIGAAPSGLVIKSPHQVDRDPGRGDKEADALLGEELGVGGDGVVLAQRSLLCPDLGDELGVVGVGEYPRPTRSTATPPKVKTSVKRLTRAPPVPKTTANGSTTTRPVPCAERPSESDRYRTLHSAPPSGLTLRPRR